MDISELKPMNWKEGPPLPVGLDAYLPLKGLWPWVKVAAPASTTGTLVLTINPVGATILVSGSAVSAGTITGAVPRTYTWSSPAGYITQSGAFTIVAGQTTKLNVVLIATTQPPVSSVLSSIAVNPTSPTSLVIGGTQQFTATGTYSDGSLADITSKAAWVSGNTGIITISSGGLATGVAAGTANITATLSGVTSPAVSLAVLAPVTVSNFNPGDVLEATGFSYTLTVISVNDTNGDDYYMLAQSNNGAVVQRSIPYINSIWKLVN